MIELEYLHFVIPNQLMYQGSKHQRLLTSHIELHHMPLDEKTHHNL